MTTTKRDNNSVVTSASHIILDIEGTTSSISFVKDVLFPYVRKHLDEYLNKNWDTSEVQEIVKNFKAQAKDDEEKKVEGVVAIPDSEDKQTVLQAIVNNVNWQMDNDRKTNCLKVLQGLIMEEGYKAGELKGHVYDDVEQSLKLWSEDNKVVYIYSSGSVHAQKLLFGHSEKGDLLPFIKGHFDTTVGMKGEAASYTKILEEISCDATEVAFLTDVPKEARAAKYVGIMAILLSREGNTPLTDADRAEFSVITSFTDIEFEINCKKRKMCPESDVTNDNKPVTNCTVSFEGEVEPNNPNINTNSDVEMMEVEESCATDKSVEKIKTEHSEEIKVEEEVQESSHKDQKESNDSPVQEKLENFVEKSETVTVNTNQENAIDTTKQEDAKGEKDTTELNSKENEKNVENKENHEVKAEKDISENTNTESLGTLKEESKETNENKTEDKNESESKKQNNICQDNSSKVTLKEELKDDFEKAALNRDVSSENTKVKTVQENIELEADKKVCENKIPTESSATLKAESEENVNEATLTEDLSSENVDNNIESVTPKTNKEDSSESACVNSQPEIDAKIIESSLEGKIDNVTKPSSEIKNNEQLSEMNISEPQEKSLSSSAGEENTVGNDSDRVKAIEQSDKSMEVECRAEPKTESQEEDMIEKDSDKNKKVEPMEVESASKLHTESQVEDSALKLNESRNEPEVVVVKPSSEESNHSTDMKSKSDIKQEDGTLSVVDSEHIQTSISSEDKIVSPKNLEATSESSSVSGETEKMVSKGKLDTEVEEPAELMETESQSNQSVPEKKDDPKKEFKDTENNIKESEDGLAENNIEESTESKETKTEIENVPKVLEKKDNSEDGSEKQVETETNNMCGESPEETFISKEIKTETKIVSSAENNGLNSKSNEIVEKTEEIGGEKISEESKPVLNDGVSLNGTGTSQNGKLANGNATESQLNGSSSPNSEQEIIHANDIAKPVEGKKCDNTENTSMETVVEA